MRLHADKTSQLLIIDIYDVFISGFFNSAVLSLNFFVEIFTADSLSLAEFVSVEIFEIFRSVLKISRY